MAFPIKVCAVCQEEFELKPDKPGLAIHCPNCTEDQAAENAKDRTSAGDRKANSEMNEARREAMRNLLYRKDS
jgi:hypothetical protein